jgi:CBS domain-containing protein
MAGGDVAMKVTEVMTRDVACCRPDDSLSVPARLMWDCDCGTVPVVDRSSGRALGMITDRDICMATLMQDRPPSAIRVAEVMSRELYSCTPESEITDAERIMRDRRIRRLPVLDTEGRLLGILSLADIVRTSERERSRARRTVAPEEVTSTLGEICRPHENGASRRQPSAV